MQPITYTQVYDLVKKLSQKKLRRAYDFLNDLAKEDEKIESPQMEFMRLSPTERHQLLEEQALYMAPYYEETETERDEWQAGDFIDEH